MRTKYLIFSTVFLLVQLLLAFPPLPVSQAWGQNGPDPAQQKGAIASGAGKSVVQIPPSAGPSDREFATLTPFGNEFFRSAAATTATTAWDAKDRKNVPAPMQYRVGPEDKIKLVLRGGINARYELTVDKKGRIDIPRIGSIFVAGMTFEEMSKQVIKKAEETDGVKVDIFMNALKTISISVQGEVQRPGPHTVGAFATVTDALLVAGGPKKTGSVRNVQVRRKGITVASFDLYDLLLKGFKAKDITLMAGDEVFVPIKGTEVGIAGSVRRPAFYELKDSYDLENLIGLAGGVIPATEALRIQIERISGNDRKVIYDVSEQDMNLKKSVPPVLQDWDLILISPFAERSAVAAVPLPGNVLPPGKDAIKSEMKPLLLLPGKTYQSGKGYASLSQQAADPSSQNIAAGDSLKYVTLSGEFKIPGHYPIKKGEKLSSVIERAGGYTSNAYLRGAYFTRESVRQVQQQNLNSMAQRISRELFPQGATGIAAQSDTDNIKAMQAESELKLRFVEYMKSLKASGRLTISISHPRLLKNSVNDIEMESGDNLNLPRNSNVVNVIGAVMAEGPHIYDKLDYREYISAAGGYARHADESDIFVIKVDGSARKLLRGFIEWSNSNERWEITAFRKDNKQIESGDVIVVPEKLTHIAWLKPIGDNTRLLMNTAVLTGKVLRLR